MKKARILMTAVITLLIVGCGNPLAEYQAMIKSYNFIPFMLPLASTRVGTIVRGSNNDMYIYAPPEECLPDLPAYQSLRYVQATDLPNQNHTVSFEMNADVNTIAVAGNPVLSFKSDFKYVKSVQITFEGASIEYLNEMNFANYFADGMSAACKSALTKYPFILQALRIEGMDFVFKDDMGATISINTQNINQIVNIDAGVNWSINNDYELKVTTPKFIGYRLGLLSPDGSGRIAKEAITTDAKGNWIFEPAQKSAMFSLLPRWSRPAEPLSAL